jgi:hypothetical protein
MVLGMEDPEQVSLASLLPSGVESKRRPGRKLREKGKKESQVFTSVADNPGRVFELGATSPECCVDASR